MHSCYAPPIGRKSIRVQGSLKGAFNLSFKLLFSHRFIQNDFEALEIPPAWTSTY